jgi:hypothetical protein
MKAKMSVDISQQAADVGIDMDRWDGNSKT